MPYDKPKVTIDLEEYQNLMKQNAELRLQLVKSDVSMYKKAIYFALTSSGRTDLVQRNCEKEGIRFFIQNARAFGHDAEEWEGISISKIDQPKIS